MIIFFILFLNVCYCFDVITIGTASHFELGQEIGTVKSIEILHSFELLSDELAFYMDYFNKNTTTRELYQVIYNNHKRYFPDLMDELNGMIAGVNNVSIVNDTSLFIFNILNDLELYLPYDNTNNTMEFNSKNKNHCSDILMIQGKDIIAGHNEDWSKDFINDTFILRYYNISSGSVSPNNNLGDKDTWTSYTYAGQLSGDAFGFNEYGLAISINSLYPKDINLLTGASLSFLGRSILHGESISNVIALLKRYPIMSGLSINIASINELQICNIEISANNLFSIHYYNFNDIQSSIISHFNTYKYLNINQYDNISSNHRQQRYQQMNITHTIDSIKNFLGDTDDIDYPIYRNGHGKDSGTTLATAIYNLTSHQYYVYHQNPKESQPYIIFTLQNKRYNPNNTLVNISFYLYLMIMLTTGILIFLCVGYIWRKVHLKSAESLQKGINSVQYYNPNNHNNIIDSQSSTNSVNSGVFYGHLQ